MKTAEEMLSRAIGLASLTFVDTFDAKGEPHILHCLYVMRKVQYHSTEAMIVAILHDIIKNSEVTAKFLIEEGFTTDIVTAIKVLTKTHDITFDDYLQNVKDNELARIVKIADLEHDMIVNRLNELSISDFANMKKYAKAYRYLK